MLLAFEDCFFYNSFYLFDLDGTCAKFVSIDTLETLYEKGYFLNLQPIQSVVDAIKELLENHREDSDIYILSAVLSDSKYALTEKNQWIDKYLPGIDKEHRIFSVCGDDKGKYIPGGIRETDVLVDDYTKNLLPWQPPGIGLKLLNGINHTNGKWEGAKVSFDKRPEKIAEDILRVGRGILVQDERPKIYEKNILLKSVISNPHNENDKFEMEMAELRFQWETILKDPSFCGLEVAIQGGGKVSVKENEKEKGDGQGLYTVLRKDSKGNVTFQRSVKFEVLLSELSMYGSSEDYKMPVTIFCSECRAKETTNEKSINDLKNKNLKAKEEKEEQRKIIKNNEKKER